jgi:glycosyltransferase involved in cell wall biosynthesis
VNLSICIPGYNRPQFLAWTLDRLERDFPDAEVIVSDDGSTEDMSPVHGRRAKWIQQEHVGPFPNLRLALLAASRKYAAYCANDDYLLPERVVEAVAYLDSHPEVSAYIAPCEVWDEVNQRSLWNTWTGFKEPVTFGPTHEDALKLWNFIIQNHVWPEHGIYRTPVPLRPRTRAYWCFTDLVDLLERGPIHFGVKPFYRNLLVHPVGEREQLGNV